MGIDPYFGVFMVNYSLSKYITIRGIEMVKVDGFAKNWDVKTLTMHTMWIQYFLNAQVTSIIQYLVDQNSFSANTLKTIIKSRMICDDWSYVYKDLPDTLSRLENIANRFTEYLQDTRTIRDLIIKHFEQVLQQSKDPSSTMQREITLFQNIVNEYKEKLFYDDEILEILQNIDNILDHITPDLT